MKNLKLLRKIGALMHTQVILNLVPFEDHELRGVAKWLQVFKGHPIHIQSRDKRQAELLQQLMKELQ